MLRFSANLSTMFLEHPLLNRFERASKAGFKGVEMWFPYDIPASELAGTLAGLELELVAINSRSVAPRLRFLSYLRHRHYMTSSNLRNDTLWSCYTTQTTD